MDDRWRRLRYEILKNNFFIMEPRFYIHLPFFRAVVFCHFVYSCITLMVLLVLPNYCNIVTVAKVGITFLDVLAQN